MVIVCLINAKCLRKTSDHVVSPLLVVFVWSFFNFFLINFF